MQSDYGRCVPQHLSTTATPPRDDPILIDDWLDEELVRPQSTHDLSHLLPRSLDFLIGHSYAANFSPDGHVPFSIYSGYSEACFRMTRSSPGEKAERYTSALPPALSEFYSENVFTHTSDEDCQKDEEVVDSVDSYFETEHNPLDLITQDVVLVHQYGGHEKLLEPLQRQDAPELEPERLDTTISSPTPVLRNAHMFEALEAYANIMPLDTRSRFMDQNFFSTVLPSWDADPLSVSTDDARFCSQLTSWMEMVREAIPLSLKPPPHGDKDPGVKPKRKRVRRKIFPNSLPNQSRFNDWHRSLSGYTARFSRFEESSPASSSFKFRLRHPDVSYIREVFKLDLPPQPVFCASGS